MILKEGGRWKGKYHRVTCLAKKIIISAFPPKASLPYFHSKLVDPKIDRNFSRVEKLSLKFEHSIVLYPNSYPLEKLDPFTEDFQLAPKR